MKRSIPIVGLLMLVVLTLDVIAAPIPHFYLEATLRDGKEVKGTLQPENAKYEGETPDGKKVQLKLEKLPDYAKRKWDMNIKYDEKRELFVVKASGWTGDLKKIWDSFELDAVEGGGKVTLKGADVQEVNVRYVKEKK